MLSLQHVMAALIAAKGNKQWLEEHLAPLIYPDAIRAYSGPRQFSHFEESPDGSDVSWWEMPADLKHLTRESVKESLEKHAHKAWDKQMPFGEKTHIDVFLAHNQHLPKRIHIGVHMHLRQDCAFDVIARNLMNGVPESGCIYLHDGTWIKSGLSRRELITKAEQEGMYHAAHVLWREYGILCSQKWVNDFVSSVVRKEYPEELAEKTMQYMRIDPELNAAIERKDWSLVNRGIMPGDTYERFYLSDEMQIPEYPH